MAKKSKQRFAPGVTFPGTGKGKITNIWDNLNYNPQVKAPVEGKGNKISHTWDNLNYNQPVKAPGVGLSGTGERSDKITGGITVMDAAKNAKNAKNKANTEPSYVKKGGKATGDMKDYAIGSKKRYDEYNRRGLAQDRTSSGGGMTDVKKISVPGVSTNLLSADVSRSLVGITANEKIAASKPPAAKTKNERKTVKAINKATKNIKKTDKGQTGTVENKEGQTSTAKQRMQLKAGARMLKNNLNAAAKKQNKETKKTKSTVPTINKKKNINYSGM